MKNSRYSAIAYDRAGPVADMYVPQVVTIAPAQQISRRGVSFVIAALLIAAVPTLFFPGGTFSYFSDQEDSIGNTLAAGLLNFTAVSNLASTTLIAGQAGQTFGITVTPVVGSLPFLYAVTATTSGSVPFCAAITASGGTPLSYTGTASTIVTGPTSSLTPWSLVLTLPSGAPGVVDGQVCILDLTYQAYQLGGAVGTEYHDTEHVTLTLTADPPVVTPVTQTGLLSNLDQSSGGILASASSTDPTTSVNATTTVDVSTSTPDAPPPADNLGQATTTPPDSPPIGGSSTPPSDPIVSLPDPTTDQTVDTSPTDTVPTDPAPTSITQ